MPEKLSHSNSLKEKSIVPIPVPPGSPVVNEQDPSRIELSEPLIGNRQSETIKGYKKIDVQDQTRTFRYYYIQISEFIIYSMRGKS